MMRVVRFLAALLLVLGLAGTASAQGLRLPDSLSQFELTSSPAAQSVPPDQNPDYKAFWKRLAKRAMFASILRGDFPSDDFWAAYFKYRQLIAKIDKNPNLKSLSLAQTAADAEGQSLSIAVVGAVAFGKANFSSVSQYLGGVEVLYPLRPNLAITGELTLGITHFPGENYFSLNPVGGIALPLSGGKFAFEAQIGLGTINFNGFVETGPRFTAGISLPLGRE